MKVIHASKLARAMVCAGSLDFNTPKEEPGDAAKEGTAAAEYLEKLLLGQEIGTHAENGVPFDDDMDFYARALQDELEKLVDLRELNCEQNASWTTTTGIKISCRYDMSFVIGHTLYVDDYKYGWGIIEPKENWQLICYAIGEVIRRKCSFEKIVMRIHQPRPHHELGSTREWEITYAELLEYKQQIEDRMLAIEQGEKSLATSNNCKYCPAAACCPAFNKAYHRGVEVVTDFLQDDMEEEELSFQLDLLTRIEELVKTRKSSLEQLVIHRIKDNKLIPNYIAKDSYGNRVWKSDMTPDAIKAMTGKDITKKAVLSPAQAEKIGVDKKLMESLTTAKFKGQKITRVNTAELGENIFGKRPL